MSTQSKTMQNKEKYKHSRNNILCECGRVLNYNFRSWQKVKKTTKTFAVCFIFSPFVFDDFHFRDSLCTYFALVFNFKFVIVFVTREEGRTEEGQTNKNINKTKKKQLNLLRSAKWLPNKNKTSHKLNYMASKTNTKLGKQNRMKSK